MKRGNYNSCLNNKELFLKCFNEYQNRNEIAKNICAKYNFSYSTYNHYLRIHKTKNLMEGGEIKQQKKQNNDNIMEVMHNVSRRGNKNKHSGFTDIIEQNEKKKEQEQEKTKTKTKSNNKVVDIDDLDKIYGTTKFLNEIDKKISKV